MTTTATEADFQDLATHIDENPSYEPDDHDREIVRWMNPEFWARFAQILSHEALTRWMQDSKIETFLEAARRMGAEGKSPRSAFRILGLPASLYPTAKVEVEAGHTQLCMELAQARVNGESVESIAMRVNIPASTIHRWTNPLLTKTKTPGIADAVSEALLERILSDEGFIQRVAAAVMDTPLTRADIGGSGGLTDEEAGMVVRGLRERAATREGGPKESSDSSP